MCAVRAASSLVVLALTARLAAADAPTDRSREIHGALLAGGGATYLIVEFALKRHLAPEQCRLCDPPRFDEGSRDLLVWEHKRAANALSTVVGYAGAPAFAIGMLISSGDDDHRRWVDDAIPVLEASVAVGLFHHLVKFTVGRQRPFVHHAPAGRAYDTDDNASLFSGHTGLAFACAVSAGVIAHERGYSSEPAIWAGGLTIAALTGYLRIAADKHWTTDVLLGGVVGTGFGLLFPLVVHRDAIVPASDVHVARVVSFGGMF